MSRVILIFLKEPQPGRVKTRLAVELGEEQAALAYRRMVARVIEQCRRARPDRIVIAHNAPHREHAVRAWLDPYLAPCPCPVDWLAQTDGDLGDRLDAATSAVFAICPEASLAVVGTDCVHLESALFESCWHYLESDRSDVVYGPAEDGGYYLLGMKEPRPVLFRGIPWSTENALAASLEAADGAGLETVLLAPRRDVDTISEWKEVEKELSSRRCVFFDRDGVVNRSPGPGYVLHENEFHLNPGIAGALCRLKDHDWLVILVTSQRGVGKGLMTREDLARIHREMQRELSAQGAAFDGIYAYTGAPGDPHQPKPDPEMILSAAEAFSVDLSTSWIIGDADRDIAMGRAAGLAGCVRIKGETGIGIEADYTLTETTEILNFLEIIL